MPYEGPPFKAWHSAISSPLTMYSHNTTDNIPSSDRIMTELMLMVILAMVAVEIMVILVVTETLARKTIFTNKNNGNHGFSVDSGNW